MEAFKTILAILPNQQKKQAVLLCILSVIRILLETLSIGIIVPVMHVILKGDFYKNNIWIKQVFHLDSQTQFIALIMFGFVLVYLIKAVYLVFYTFYQTKFAYGLQEEKSQQLFGLYLDQPYNFHLKRNSAQLIRNATGDVQVISNTVNNLIEVVTESLLCVAVVSLLLVREPIGALVVTILIGSASFVFLKYTKSKIAKWGKAKPRYEGMRIQHIQQGLGGIKDVLLLGRANVLKREYRKANSKFTECLSKNHIVSQLPRLGLEFLTILGLAILVAVMAFQNQNIESIIPTLGLFGAAAFKMLPTANKIVTCLQALNYGTPVLLNLKQELELSSITQNSKDQLRINHLSESIKINDICFSYEGSETKVLNKINFTIKKGSNIGFIGESGSGKSTLIDIIVGLLGPDSGNIKVDNKDIVNDIRSWQSQIGYVSQTIFLTDDTLRKNIAFGISDQDIDDVAIQSAVKSSGLDKFTSALPDGLETMVGERGVRLSGGQRQRIAIARAMYHDPDVIVLDEATSALDNNTEKEIMDSIYSMLGEKTILIIAHRLNTVKNCDYIYKLSAGDIIDQGPPSKFTEVHKAL